MLLRVLAVLACTRAGLTADCRILSFFRRLCAAIEKLEPAMVIHGEAKLLTGVHIHPQAFAPAHIERSRQRDLT